MIGTQPETTPRPSTSVGGHLRINLASDIDSTDPALGYHSVSWQCEYATQAKLFNHPDQPGADGTELVPEIAVDFPEVSNDGRTYTFKLRSGSDAYRFNTGEVVTAQNFAAALNRVLDPRMQSPATTFVNDIVGAAEVIGGRATGANGIRVLDRDVLQIELTTPLPLFLTWLSMPFFAPIPLNLPADSEALTPPSAGPYYIASRVPGRSIVLRRNPYYRHARPCPMDEIDYRIGVDPELSVNQIEAGEADYVGDGIAPELDAVLGARYGVNQGRFLVSQILQLDYLAMNTTRPLFSDPRIRRAVNFAIDRHPLLEARGMYSGVVTDHIIPPGMPGYQEDMGLYPLDGPDVERARAELPEDFAGGHAVVYTQDTLAGPTLGRILQANLEPLGISVEVKLFPETTMHQLAGRRGEPCDAIFTHWAADYPDPHAYFNTLLDGRLIREKNNFNFAYFDDPVYNRKIEAAGRLSGPSRFEAYEKLDREISWDAAPWASYDNRTGRDFVSNRVVGAFRHVLYGLDLAAISLKS